MPDVPARLLGNVRRLRSEQTDAESVLWRHLRNRQLLGFKFRRQHAITPYVVDFYCHEASLVIELDGGHHAKMMNQDMVRKNYLESKGLLVLRFWNNEVLQETEAVLQKILQILENNC